ncbi:MFS transporter [Streptomyces sp. NPDC055078]
MSLSLDEIQLNRRHIRLLVQSSGGPFLDGWLLTIVAVALVGMEPELGLTDFEIGAIGAAAFAGIFVGGLVFGRLTDVIGRKLMYVIDLVALVAFSGLSGLAVEPWQVIAFRFLAGVAIGADYPIVLAMLVEWVPRRHRAPFIGWLSIAWAVGATCAAIVGWLMVEFLGEDSWRWIIASPVVPGLIVLAMRWGSPESPRWLARQGREAEAQAIVEDMFGANTRLEVEDEGPGQGPGGFRALNTPRNIRMLVFCSVFYTCSVAPVFALYTFGPTMLETFGLGEGNLAFVGSAVISVLFMAGQFPALRLVETVGRRRLLIWCFGLMVLPLTVLGVIPEAPALVIIGCFSAYAILSGPAQVMQWAYPSELFATDVRATAIGIVTSASRIGVAATTYLLPAALSGIGTGPTMLIFALITALGLLVSVWLAPETQGRTLAESSAADRPPSGGGQSAPATPRHESRETAEFIE